jgi:regulator of replication initiation timing
VATAEELRRYTGEVQRESEKLKLMVHELRHINDHLKDEVKHLRDELAASQKEQDALRGQLHSLKIQQIYELPSRGQGPKGRLAANGSL